jgi:hypothetical protein
MLAAGSVVSATTAFRIGASAVELVARRTPPLLRLAVKASTDRREGGKAQLAFRDELIALARESAERTWLEMRRGVDDLDTFTRLDGASARRLSHRPYRVKP